MPYVCKKKCPIKWVFFPVELKLRGNFANRPKPAATPPAAPFVNR